MNSKVLEMKEHSFYSSIDILRIIAFVVIIVYHYFMALYANSLNRLISFGPNNILVISSVSLFFLLSGFSSMCAYDSGFRIGAYYKKRFWGILVPFYIVWLFWFAVRFYEVKTWPFDRGIPLWRFIYTAFALDEYAAMRGVTTFSFGIGEWFLGCLIILIVLFPLFRYLINRNENLFFFLALVVYVVLLIKNPIPDTPSHMNICYKAFDFVLGMYLYKKRSIIRLWMVIPAAIIFVVFLVLTTGIVPIVVRSAFMASTLFTAFYAINPLLEKKRVLCDHLRAVHGYLYAVYLTHHLVIYRMTGHFEESIDFWDRERVILLLLEVLVIVLVSVLLKKCTDKLRQKYITQALR